MSNDEVRWCDNDKKKTIYSNETIGSTSSDVNASHTFLSAYHINDDRNSDISIDDCYDNDDDQISIINIHKHRNIHIKRDSRHNHNFYDDYHNSTDSIEKCHHLHPHHTSNHHSHHTHQSYEQKQQQQPSSKLFRNYYQIVNVCLIIMLHVVCNFLVTSVNCDELMDSVGARGHYTHTWAVHIPGGEHVAKLVAEDHGMILRGKIIDDHYHMEHRSIAKRSISPSHHHQRRLNEDNRVVWSAQQKAKSRQKRDFTRLKPKSISKLLNDPKWTSMWYLNRGDGLDMNVVPAWREGITGKGVVVTILDDGLETDHPDLAQNYDPEASWDVNSHDADPMPHYDMTDSNRHGTRCAGEVAATANNSLCAVGIAYNARVGGVRMLDGDVTDSVEAMSLGLNPQHIDIYSASWGPDDDGKTVDGPGEMATKAFIDGVTKGRGGKGSIFVWASGNGGREQDNCNCDGYTNSIWTLSISSATEYGDIPWYSEKCSSTLATTYSSGQQNEKQVVTTDLHHLCTSSHTGTSASAPLAAGIVALALEANPNLTWRDMQHIVVRTANPVNLGKSSNEWTENGVRRKVSHSFGYGLMDAAAMVRLARVWETVPEQQRCEIHSPHLDKPIPPKRNVTFTLKVDHCKGVNYLEHVQARITLTTQRRGDIVIYLTSPSGTRTCLLTERIHDISRSGFSDWPFMTVHQWGEAPHGVWELEIHNKGRYMEFALLRYWTLILHGTVISAQKNDDDVGQISNNSQLLNISNSNGRSKPQNNNNNSGAATNRKTSSQQKASTLSPQATTVTRKNGKQKNNNNNNNSNNNKNGKNNQKTTSSSLTTTVRPSYTTIMLNQFSIGTQMGKNKTKFNQNASTNVPRPPRPTAKLPNTKSNANNNNNNNNGNNNNSNNNNLLSSSKLDKYQPSYSNIYEKSSGKAPKQVKENSYTTPRLSEGPTPNPSISKMFERYEKIEEIFPELEPYKEVNPVFFTVSNGKPSRENSKSFSSFVSFDTVPQKKNTPIDDVSQTRQKIVSSSSALSQGTSNGKGQITQWNLIFYGTSDPPQKNDPPRYQSGNNKKTVNDIVHNSLENSQWGFITQDVAEMGSHSDVQRTVDDDLTSSACLHYSDNNKSFCLECAHQTFIFNGRCYNTCPERSFIVQEKVSENIQSKGLSVKKRRHVMNIDDFDSLDDIIGGKMSEYIVRNRAISSPDSSIILQKLCGSCHEVCFKCNGPTENDCLTCDSDFNQIIIGSEIICQKRKSSIDEISIVHDNSLPTSTAQPANKLFLLNSNDNKSVLNSIANQLKNYSIEKIVLVSSTIGILLMIISICIYLLFIKCDCDILSSFYSQAKQFLLFRSASTTSSLNGNEREKYSYNIVEMEERSPLTTAIMNDSQTSHGDDDEYEDSDVSQS